MAVFRKYIWQRDWLLQRDKPLVGNAEGQRALVGVIKPVALIAGPVLIEPCGFLGRRVHRQRDVEAVQGLLQAVPGPWNVYEGSDDDDDPDEGYRHFAKHIRSPSIRTFEAGGDARNPSKRPRRLEPIRCIK
ncbi:MAG TPA: hypothetical protein VN065_20525 [Bradyrhizobium sp.]|nr:hypothetical protein [Bradyrhizobium sp.]